MRVEDVAPALRERLGPEATDGLLATLDETGREWTTAVVTQMVDRFERRLTEGLSGLRVELAAQRAEFREELAAQRAEFREGLASQRADLHEGLASQRADLREGLASQRAEFREGLASQRAELLEAIAAQGAGLRSAMAEQGAALRGEIAASRSDILRWMFVFWTGQLIALAALLNVLL